ncbi:universal stress protein [Rhodohalobacter sp.]|uniref:universal stress protein n=1 Tax=Rhodohalobacter sp. TaxID=1974210 RepID=UPI002ACEC0C9|nr:universal stress protein [Rhodohalobacter sp.]MDZ7756837.1 universal stress protein [Rhodohalobacter sp.]
MKFKHALLAVDLSKSSKDLVHCMGDLKTLGIEKITLVTAVSKPYPGGPEKFDTSSFEAKLESYSQNLRDQGFDTDWELKVESNIYAPVTILKTAKELQADLLILGHRGHNRFSELFLGSVATEVIQRAILPVLLLRISDDPDKNDVSICKNLTHNILLPTDFSENADRAMEVLENDMLSESNVTILHVQPASTYDVSTLMEDRENKLKEMGLKQVQSDTKSGNVGLTITEYADENDISMIIMGSQGKGFVENLFVGSNSMRVARHTSKPLLLIPADR